MGVDMPQPDKQPTPIEKNISFAGRVGATLIKGTLEGLIGGLLKFLTPDRLNFFIAEDQTIVPTLLEIQRQYQSDPESFTKEGKIGISMINRLFITVKLLASRVHPKLICKYMTAGYALSYAKRNRSDLYKILNTEAGKRFLLKQMKEVRVYIYNYDPIIDSTLAI